MFISDNKINFWTFAIGLDFKVSFHKNLLHAMPYENFCLYLYLSFMKCFAHRLVKMSWF